MRTQPIEILGLGVCSLDILCEVERLPGSDTKLKVDRFIKQGGGLVGTAMVAAARLGARVAYVGAMGDDEFAAFCLHEFEKEGVSTEHVTIVPGKSVITAFIMAEKATGGRTILYTVADQPPTHPEHVQPDILNGVRVLHTDAHFPEAAIHAARLARERGVTITVDIEYMRPGVEELLDLSDYAIVPRKFVEEYVGPGDLRESAQGLFRKLARSRARRAVVVTDGVQGSEIVTHEGEFHQPAFRVDVVDTTGCGDVYHGAFAFGLARGLPLHRIADVAAATAALKCRKLGGRAGIPSLGEVEAFLKSGPQMY